MKPMDLGNNAQTSAIAPDLNLGSDTYELYNWDKLGISFVSFKIVAIIFMGNIE